MQIRKKITASFLLFALGIVLGNAQIDWSSYNFGRQIEAGVYIPVLQMNALFYGSSITYVGADGTQSLNELSNYGGLPKGWNGIDAAVKWDDKTVMLFKSFEYAVLDLDAVTIEYRGAFPDIPETVTAAVEFGSTQLLFFTGGDSFVIYDKEDQTVSEPQSLTAYGSWEMTDVDAAVNALDGYIYLFNNGFFQRLNTQSLELEGRPQRYAPSNRPTNASTASSLPPVATERTALPPTAEREGSAVARNEDIRTSFYPGVKKKGVGVKKTSLDTASWCLTGVPKGSSESDLVESVTAMGGGSYDEPYEDLVEQGHRVAEIRVWGSYVIVGIQTVLQSPEGEFVELPILGSKKGRTNTLKVDEGDCVIGIQGTYGGAYGDFVHSLYILTSKGKSKIFGSPGRRNFKLNIPNGTSFYGFAINHHNYVASIGLKYVGYEDQIPDEDSLTGAGANASFTDKYKGEYTDDHEDYMETLIDAQFGAADGSRLELPAVEWLGKGVDILYLDPLDIGGSPTKESPIVLIASRKTGGQEGKKQIPHGTDYKTVGGGSQHEYKEWVESYADFTTNFGVGMGVSVGTPLGGGSLSGSYRQMNNTKVGSEEVYFTRTVERNLFNLNMDLLWRDRRTGQKKRQKLDFEFREMVDNLPVTSAIPSLATDRMIKGKRLPGSISAIKGPYAEIIQTFGTHITGNVNFGGKYVAATKIKKSDYEATRMSEFDFRAEANAQIKAVNIGANVSFDYKNQSTIGRKSGTLNTNTYVQGGSGETVFETWNTSLTDRPVPIEVKLIPTYELLTRAFWPNDPDIDKKRKILKLVTEKYQVDNGAPPKPSKGDFFTGVGSRKTKYKYTLTLTAIKASGSDDEIGGGDIHEISGSIAVLYAPQETHNKLPSALWHKESDKIDVPKDGQVSIGIDYEETLDETDIDGVFTVTATLKEEDVSVFVDKDDVMGTKSKTVYIKDIGDEPKEYSLSGFYGGGTSAEVLFTVRRELVYNR